MSGRPTQKKANTDALKQLLVQSNSVSLIHTTDISPLVAIIMRESGCTYQEIADVFEVSRQQAMTIVERSKERL